MIKHIKKAKGFTLIELIVVIAILAILAAILIPSITNYIGAANKAKNSANARSFYTAVVLEVSTTSPTPSGTSFTPTAKSGTNPCSTTSVGLTNGAVTSFSCTIDTVQYTLANNFSPS